MKKILIATLMLNSIFSIQIFSQKTIKFTESNHEIKRAEDYMNLGLYFESYAILRDYLHNLDTIKNTILEIENAKYDFYVSALKSNKPNAPRDLEKFLEITPFQKYRQLGNFQMAQYFFNKNDFENAIPHYEKTGFDYLTNQEISVRNFELGYCYLVTQQLEKVNPLFSSVKNIPGDYFKPGNYYYGILSYYNKNYKEAKESFELVANEDRYKKIVPFYLTEIEYLTGNPEAAKQIAEQQLQSSDTWYYQKELNQLLGQIYFEENDYVKSQKYFEDYISSLSHTRKEDFFRLGYSQYQQADIKGAIKSFSQMNFTDDAISQKGCFYLATCFLKDGNKQQALSYFEKASEMNADNELKEIANFNAAKLHYEVSDDPEARKSLQTFINEFPNSKYVDEATELMAYLDIKTNRFDDAIMTINKMTTISDPVQKVYQRANYARGIQMLLSENPSKALEYFNESDRFKIDQGVHMLNAFWQAECYYRLGKYYEANQYADYYIGNSANDGNIKQMHLLKSYVYLNQNNSEEMQHELNLYGDPSVTDLSTSFGETKPAFVPDRVPIAENDPYIIVYQIPEIPLDFSYSPVPLKPLAMEGSSQDAWSKHFIKLGIGNLNTYLFESGYNFTKYAKTPLYLDFKSTASKGSITNQRYAELAIRLTANKTYTNFSFTPSVSFEKKSYQYYGYDHSKYFYDKADLKQMFANFTIQSGIEILKSNGWNLDTHPFIRLGIYGDRFKATELSAYIDVPASMPLKRNYDALLGMKLDANLYSVSSFGSQNNSMLQFKLGFHKQFGNFNVNAMLKPTFGQQAYLLPDIVVQYPLKNTKMVASAAWQCDLNLNTFKQMTTLNPFIFNYYKVSQSMFSDLYGKLEGTIMPNLNVSGKVGIEKMNNMPLFLNDTLGDGKQFNILYAKKASLFILDASAEYTLNKNTFMGATAKLRPIISLTSQKNAWHYIPATYDIYAKVKLSKDIWIRADAFLRSGSTVMIKNDANMFAQIQTLKSGLDMNLSSVFKLANKWNGFINVNNLFGSKYQRWSGYQQFGTNILAGVVYSFNSDSPIPKKIWASF